MRLVCRGPCALISLSAPTNMGRWWQRSSSVAIRSVCLQHRDELVSRWQPATSRVWRGVHMPRECSGLRGLCMYSVLTGALMGFTTGKNFGFSQMHPFSTPVTPRWLWLWHPSAGAPRFVG